MNYEWSWRVFLDAAPDGKGTYLDSLIAGLGWTLATALVAWILALAVGSAVGIARTMPQAWVRRLGNAYVELFRNIPLLVQMFLWFYVLPEVVPKAFGDWMKSMAPPWASYLPAVLCLGFFTAARIAEQVRAGIQSVPRGQYMAGTALGLTLGQTYRHVLLPVAYRIILPPLTSEFMNIIKNSAVALTISLVELTFQARSMSEFTFKTFEAFAAATVIYIVVNIIVVLAMRWVEHRVRVPGFIGSVQGPQAGH